MARTLSATLSTAVSQSVTKPIYLVALYFGGSGGPNQYATWATDITANPDAESPAPGAWLASGLEVSSLTNQRAILRFPVVDQYLSLALTNNVRGGRVRIYQWYEDATASPIANDAVLVFDGLMDGAEFGEEIRIACVESREVKQFPPGLIDYPVFTFLPTSGTKIVWGNDTVVVN